MRLTGSPVRTTASTSTSPSLGSAASASDCAAPASSLSPALSLAFLDLKGPGIQPRLTSTLLPSSNTSGVTR